MVPKETCTLFLCSDLQRFFHLFYDVEQKAITTQAVNNQTLCSKIIFTTTIRADRTSYLDVQKQIAIGKRRICLHIFHVVNEYECDGGMTSNVQK